MNFYALTLVQVIISIGFVFIVLWGILKIQTKKLYEINIPFFALCKIIALPNFIHGIVLFILSAWFTIMHITWLFMWLKFLIPLYILRLLLNRRFIKEWLDSDKSWKLINSAINFYFIIVLLIWIFQAYFQVSILRSNFKVLDMRSSKVSEFQLQNDLANLSSLWQSSIKNSKTISSEYFLITDDNTDSKIIRDEKRKYKLLEIIKALERYRNDIWNYPDEIPSWCIPYKAIKPYLKEDKENIYIENDITWYITPWCDWSDWVYVYRTMTHSWKNIYSPLIGALMEDKDSWNSDMNIVDAVKQPYEYFSYEDIQSGQYFYYKFL